MATQSNTVECITEQLTGIAHRIRTRKMFGEYALYCDEKVVALICDDQLFVKITPASRPFLDSTHDASPYPGAKLHLNVHGDAWEDRDWLCSLIVATADSLPERKPKS